MSPRLLATLAVGLAALTVAGCGSADAGSDGSSSGKIDVVASTNVWGSVAAAVGGNKVRVSSIINSPQKDPHDYQATPADAAEVSQAKLTVHNGGGYDDFFGRAVAAAGGKRGVNAFALSGQHGADANEHVFYDLPTVEKVATTIADKLAAIDPRDKRTFTTNAERFGARVQALRRRAEAVGKGKHLSAVSTESVADYLLRAAGVRDVTPRGYAEAVEKDEDVPAQAIARTNALITGRRVSMLVDNTQTETSTADQLRANASEAGIPVVKVSETLPAGTHDYLSWIGTQIDEMEHAAR